MIGYYEFTHDPWLGFQRKQTPDKMREALLMVPRATHVITIIPSSYSKIAISFISIYCTSRIRHILYHVMNRTMGVNSLTRCIRGRWWPSDNPLSRVGGAIDNSFLFQCGQKTRRDRSQSRQCSVDVGETNVQLSQKSLPICRDRHKLLIAFIGLGFTLDAASMSGVELGTGSRFDPRIAGFSSF